MVPRRLIWSVWYQSHDGKRIIVGTYDPIGEIWDIEKGEKILSLVGHTSSLCSAGFSNDDQKAFTASDDQTLKIWNATTGDFDSDIVRK